MIQNSRRKNESKSSLSLLSSDDVNKKTLINRIQSYFYSHHLAFSSATSRISSLPFQSLSISLVVAIALSLPAGFYVAVTNLQKIVNVTDSSNTITVFLKTTATQPQIELLKEKVSLDEGIEVIKYISSQQGLDEFRAESGFGDILKMLDENPLPPVFLIEPDKDIQNNSELIKKLVTRLKKEHLIENIQIDMMWLKRLQAILLVSERLSFMLGVILAFGVLLIISNAVALSLDSKSEEVIVIKLVGGTNAYVRRPFLYTGLCYGSFGGILSWIFIAIAVYWLSIPIEKLSALYQSSIELEGLGFFGLISLISIGVSLGLLGAWLAVTRQLSAIEPK
jgi:cell division transport system permease protein